MSQRISRYLEDDINFGYGAVCKEATAKREAERAGKKAGKAAQEDRRWENLSGGLTGD